MEEHIGKVWHKYISKKAINSYDEQKVYFQDLKKILKIFYCFYWHFMYNMICRSYNIDLQKWKKRG